MSIKQRRECPTNILLKSRRRLVREREHWEHRIEQIDVGNALMSRPEYERRVKRCKERIELIEETLRERGMIG